MTNAAIAAVLREIAVLCELRGENQFRARAFDAAARAVERHPVSAADLARDGRLDEIGRVGKGIAAEIAALAATAVSPLREELAAGLPPGLADLLELPGLGPKRVRRLWQELGATEVSGLEQACRDGRLVALSGFGERTRDRILRGIELRASWQGRQLLSAALRALEEAITFLGSSGRFRTTAPTGAVRRVERTVTAVELLVVPEGAGSGPIAATLHAATNETFGARHIFTTGSDTHVALLRKRAAQLGLELGDDGLRRDGERIAGATEEGVYEALGLAWIPPELREGRDEVEAALARSLPDLAERADLKGVVHAHTTASDGVLSLESLARACRERGYEYLCVSDHSRSAAYANGLSAERLLAQHAAARELEAKLAPFRIFHGVESDILADGSLDYPDDVLSELDLVIGSIHSGLSMEPEAATARLLAAIRNPFLTILGHPGGGLLLRREGYAYDEEQLLAALRESGVVLEHNCNPSRLDPDWPLLRKARGAGVRVALCPDAHDEAGLDDVRFGLLMARKAWLEPRHLWNCLSAPEIAAALTRRKAIRR